MGLLDKAKAELLASIAGYGGFKNKELNELVLDPDKLEFMDLKSLAEIAQSLRESKVMRDAILGDDGTDKA